MYPLPLEGDTIQTVKLFMQILAAHDYDGPVSVMMTLVQVKGAILEHGLTFPTFPGQTRAFDRDVVVLPDVLVEQTSVDLRQHLRPLFDALWQAGGYERSYGYDQEGKWRDLAERRS